MSLPTRDELADAMQAREFTTAGEGLLRETLLGFADATLDLLMDAGRCSQGRHVIQEGRVGCKCNGVAVLPAETPGDEIIVMVYEEGKVA